MGKEFTPSSIRPSAGPHEEGEGDVAVQVGRPKLDEPPKYAVLLHNDDYTTMEFVIEVLQRYFHKNMEEATQVMLAVHKSGRGVAGVYPYDIAETKAAQVSEAARERGYPLKCTVEKK